MMSGCPADKLPWIKPKLLRVRAATTQATDFGVENGAWHILFKSCGAI